MVKYPITLPRQLYKGHKVKPSQSYYTTEMDYGQKSRSKYFGNIPISMTFSYSETELQDFLSWFWGDGAEQLNGGVKPFQADWSILGIDAKYEFQFARGGQPDFVPTSNNRWESKMTINLLTDISEIIALNSLDGWCPEIIDCQRDFLIAAS